MKHWRVVGLILAVLLGLGVILVRSDTTDIVPPVLPEIQKKAVVPPKDQPLIPPDLPPVDKRGLAPTEQKPLIAPSLPEIKPKDFIGPQDVPLTPPQLPSVERRDFQFPQITFLEQPQLPDVGWPQVREFNDFRGGLNLSSYKTKLQPNEALVLENALWNEQGEMYKRPHYDTLLSIPEDFNFLYRYYQQDGDKYLMAGSDTALYFWQADSTTWTWLAGTDGTEGRWDGTTFEDLFVATHLGRGPVIWNGDSIITSTTLESADSFWVEWSNIIMDTIYTDCYRFRTYFKLSPPVSFEANELIGQTFEWNEHAGSSEIQRMLILSNTTNEIYATLTCSLDLVPDKPERWSWIRPWFQSTSIDSGMTDSVSVCYDDPDFCCFRPGDYAPSVRFWDKDIDTTKIERDWTYIFAATDSRGNICRNYIEDFGVKIAGTDTVGWILMNGWMVACFDEATEYEIYQLSSVFEDEGIKFVEVFDNRLWFGWTGTGIDQEKNRLIYSEPTDIAGFLVNNEIYIGSDDGDYLTGMTVFYPDQQGYRETPYAELVAGKNQSMYRVYPVTYAGVLDYKTMFISRGTGFCSDQAVQMIEGQVLAFPDQHGVYIYDGRKVQPISLKIDPIFESWGTTDLERASAVYNPQDRHYYLSHPDFWYAETTDVTPTNFMVGFPMSDGAVNGGWAHKIDSVGIAFGADLFCNTESAPAFLDIATDTLGRYVMAWQNGTEGGDVYLSRFTAGGVRFGDSLLIPDGIRIGNTKTTGIATDMDNDGHIIVCWIDDNEIDDVWCQYVDWTTGKVDTNFVVNSDWASNSYNCDGVAVSMNTDGIAVVVWKDGRNYSPNLYDPYAQIYDVPDSAIGTNIEISGSAVTESAPAVATTRDKFVVSWKAQSSPTPNIVIRKRAFNIDGTAQEEGVSLTEASVVDKAHSAVSVNDGGNYVVTWDSVGATWDIWAQKFNADNSAAGGSFPVSVLAGSDEIYPAVAINNTDVFVVVWRDYRNGAGVPAVYYRSFDWTDSITTTLPLNDSPVTDICGQPKIDIPDAPYRSIDTTVYTLAWNIDYHGWAMETFRASAYCYQHSLTDSVKVLFADPDADYVQQYGTSTGGVVLTYQSPYLSFVPNPSFEAVMSYATVEAYLDTGAIYLYWYKDYSELVCVDTIYCGTDCREEILLPDILYGKNISMKIVTGAEINEFTLSGYWWEYLISRCRE